MTEQRPFIVTIDGPAASGKSSVSREIAARFGWKWVSTGAFYRGLALVAAREKADFANEDQLAELASKAGLPDSMWSILLSPDRTRVIYRGDDVTDDIAREEVGSLASKISSFPAVRKALLAAQRSCAENAVGLVAEGRDCGTVIFPKAQVKIFLTARAEDRAARRAKEEGLSVNETHEAQATRDAQDAGRKTAPMAAPEGASIIDSSRLSLAETVALINGLISEACPN